MNKLLQTIGVIEAPLYLVMEKTSKFRKATTGCIGDRDDASGGGEAIINSLEFLALVVVLSAHVNLFGNSSHDLTQL